MIPHNVRQRTVYVFGNPHVSLDTAPYQYLPLLKRDFPHIDFLHVAPNADVPFANQSDVWILDTVCGIKNPRVFTERDIPAIELSPRTSVHDFDLGFQLKYLKKIGKLKRVTVIGLPVTIPFDYAPIHDIFKKLVAHDMQGS